MGPKDHVQSAHMIELILGSINIKEYPQYRDNKQYLCRDCSYHIFDVIVYSSEATCLECRLCGKRTTAVSSIIPWIAHSLIEILKHEKSSTVC